MKNLKQQLAAAYLDYVNNYLTAEAFAAAYGLTLPQCNLLIALGRSIFLTEPSNPIVPRHPSSR